MGQAMLRSWIKENIAQKIIVVDPSELPCEFKNEPNITHTAKYDPKLHAVPEDIMIIAVKPQILQQVCLTLNDKVSPQTIILSIAAGQSIKQLGDIFQNNPIVRVMPNTPAAIGKGANVAIANHKTKKSHKDIAHRLLTACGSCHWIDNEELMDAVTALSGSGPAYIFYFIEALSKAGEEQGLSKEIAQELARQTVIGSAALADHEQNKTAETLRQNVTSPNGTTQAALNVLMDGRMDNILTETLSAAVTRSKELGKG